jgi:hypothetical protein
MMLTDVGVPFIVPTRTCRLGKARCNGSPMSALPESNRRNGDCQFATKGSGAK